MSENDSNESCNGRRRINQFGDYDDVTNMTKEDWDFRWAKQQTKFHVPKVHPMLTKHIDKLTLKQEKQRIFVPLCGKTIDMKCHIAATGAHNHGFLYFTHRYYTTTSYPSLQLLISLRLADDGHEVIGNEYADEGCRLFFEEQNIPYTTEPLEKIDGVLYKATDGTPVRIYRCDCFDLSREMIGTFDCIWDRGGFVALPVKDRQRYANMIHTLMKCDCRYMLDTFLVDNNKFGGPPFNCSQKDVEKHFNDKCTVEKLDEKDVFGKWQESWGVTSFTEEVYLLKPKLTSSY